VNTCVKFGGAIKIDIWRVLVLYKYGGIYSDTDIGPGAMLTEDTIQADDTAFFLSDAWNRPSQWMQGMEAKSPIAYFTMLEILTRVLALSDISSIKPVFLTGPDALKHGYGRALNWQNGNFDLFEAGVHEGKFCKVRKLKGPLYESSYMSESVAWGDGTYISRKERMNRHANSTHWTQMIRETKAEVSKGTCWDHLYEADLKNSDETA
jgi:hypothetical protein